VSEIVWDLHSLNTMDTNINESCKEGLYESVRLKFVKVIKSTDGKRLDSTWSHFLHFTESKHNRYIALCMYCNKTLSGRLHFMRKHITDQCHVISSKDRGTFLRSTNKKDAPVNLGEQNESIIAEAVRNEEWGKSWWNCDEEEKVRINN